MAEKLYICESCNGRGTGLVVADRDLGKPCLSCSGTGHLTESQMEQMMTAAPRPNVFDWRLFAREKHIL